MISNPKIFSILGPASRMEAILSRQNYLTTFLNMI